MAPRNNSQGVFETEISRVGPGPGQILKMEYVARSGPVGSDHNQTVLRRG